MKQFNSALSSIIMFFVSIGILGICSFVNLLGFAFFVSGMEEGSLIVGLCIYSFLLLGFVLVTIMTVNYLYKSIKHITQKTIRKTIKVAKRYEKDKLTNLIIFDLDYFIFREMGLFQFGMSDGQMEYLINKSQFDEIREGDTLEIEYFDYSRRVSAIRRII